MNCDLTPDQSLPPVQPVDPSSPSQWRYRRAAALIARRQQRLPHTPCRSDAVDRRIMMCRDVLQLRRPVNNDDGVSMRRSFRPQRLCGALAELRPGQTSAWVLPRLGCNSGTFGTRASDPGFFRSAGFAALLLPCSAALFGSARRR